MSDWIKCDRCNKITKADSCGDKRYKIGVDGFDGYSVFHLCERCLRSFFLDFLEWKWNDDESQYVPQEGRDMQAVLMWIGGTRHTRQKGKENNE